MGSDRPRVCMLTPDRDRVDTRILLQARSLAAVGCQVIILGLPSVAPEDSLPAGVTLVTVNPNSVVTARLTHLRKLYTRLRATGRFFWALAWTRRIFETLWREPDKYFTGVFLQSARDLRADVYVAHDLPVLPAAVQAAEGAGARVVYDAHELYAEQEFAHRLRERWSEIERRWIGGADAVTTVNPGIGAALEQRYRVRRPEVLFNCPRRYTLPQPRPRVFHEMWGLSSVARIVLYQGAVVPHRNLEALVRAACTLQDPRLVIVLLGDGSERKRLMRLAKRLGLAEAVRFHAAVRPESLMEHTASADLGVVPYLGTSENTRLCTPHKLFEFVQAEVPVIAHNLPELARIIAGEGLGWIDDMSCAEAIGTAIKKWFDHYQPSFDRATFSDAKGRYCWEAQERTLYQVYEQLGVFASGIGR